MTMTRKWNLQILDSQKMYFILLLFLLLIYIYIYIYIYFHLLSYKISRLKNEQPCGTPGYVAPEILRNAPYGAEVDIWSMGNNNNNNNYNNNKNLHVINKTNKFIYKLNIFILFFRCYMLYFIIWLSTFSWWWPKKIISKDKKRKIWISWWLLEFYI